MNNLKHWGSWLLRWLVAVGLLVFIVDKIDGALLWQTLRRFDLAFGLALLSCHVAVLMLMAYRWRLIAMQMNIKADYRMFLRALWIGSLSGQIGPPLIFFEVARFKVLQDCGDSQSLIGSQLIDRLSGVIALLLMLLLTLPFSWKVLAEVVPVSVLLKVVVIATILSLVLYRFAFSSKLRAAIDREQIAVLMSPGQSHYEISALIQLLLMLGFLLAAYGLGVPQKPYTLFTLLPLIFVGLTLLPISVSDWGTREMLAVFILSFAGFSPEECAAVSIIYGFAYTLTAMFGVVFLFKK